jgi:hypothetical protein
MRPCLLRTQRSRFFAPSDTLGRQSARTESTRLFSMSSPRHTVPRLFAYARLLPLQSTTTRTTGYGGSRVRMSLIKICNRHRRPMSHLKDDACCSIVVSALIAKRLLGEDVKPRGQMHEGATHRIRLPPSFIFFCSCFDITPSFFCMTTLHISLLSHLACLVHSYKK